MKSQIGDDYLNYILYIVYIDVQCVEPYKRGGILTHLVNVWISVWNLRYIEARGGHIYWWCMLLGLVGGGRGEEGGEREGVFWYNMARGDTWPIRGCVTVNVLVDFLVDNGYFDQACRQRSVHWSGFDTEMKRNRRIFHYTTNQTNSWHQNLTFISVEVWS